MKQNCFKRTFIRIALLFAALTLLCANTLAAELSYTIDYDYMNNSVTIRGKADGETKYAAIQTLAEGKTFAEAENNPTDSSLIMYRYQKDVKNGEFLFKLVFDDDIEAGAYATRLAVDNCGDTAEFVLQLVNSDTYEDALKAMKDLAAKKDYTAFKGFVSENADKLGFNLELYNKLSAADIEPYMNYIAAISAEPHNCAKNTRDFASFVLMAALSENKAENIKTYISDTSIGQTQAAEYFARLADTEEQQRYITYKMSGKKIADITELENLLKEAIILNEVKYAAGYEGVKKIFDELGEVIGVDGNASSAVYKALCGNDYGSGSELSAAYKNLKTTESGGNIGGNISGGGSLGGSSGGIPPAKVNTGGSSQEDIKKPQKFYASFTDIDGVEWASEAILALSDNGIINGKSEGVFKPDDLITREEFAKILVCVMGYENEPAGDGLFDDVNEGDWFYSYVNIACRKGILRGTGDDKFGAGEVISRQDMTVMIYNALKIAGIEMKTAEIPFDDRDEISDYAEDAIGTLYGMRIINGMSDTRFEPLGTATRAQAAKIAYGFWQRLN